MFKLFDPVLEYVFDLDFSCKFSKLQYNCLALTGLLMRVHYPKLRNIVHIISLWMFSLLPKDQTFIFYFINLTKILLINLSFFSLVICRIVSLCSCGLKICQHARNFIISVDWLMKFSTESNWVYYEFDYTVLDITLIRTILLYVYIFHSRYKRVEVELIITSSNF